MTKITSSLDVFEMANESDSRLVKLFKYYKLSIKQHLRKEVKN